MKRSPPAVDERAAVLERTRNKKMARSPHAFVRGNTVQFYERLASLETLRPPRGPPVWICGDCHVGNLGPVADAAGLVRVQIRDLDHTVIGNPAHDLIRLGLSLASAARGSSLPGVTTAWMLEAIMDSYDSAFDHEFDEAADKVDQPKSVQLVMKRSSKRTWNLLAKERIKDTRPTIPLGKRFWPVSGDEQQAIASLFHDDTVKRLATMVRSRDDDATVEVIDSAYWVKGCGSLGRLRYAVLLGVTDTSSGATDLCLMDIKEAVNSVAPADPGGHKLDDDAQRVVEGARHISPFLGERMRATRLGDRPVFIRELLPQDLKVEIDHLTTDEAIKAARFLATVVGFAHARQMDSATRAAWRDELGLHRSETLNAPSWLWSSVVELLVSHERSYLDHCRRYATATFPTHG
ncbi:MAG: DUF2252 domain-containing protein [Actinomycetota bacterium]|nr:DUF2252 domain-containing protein [Actinomycetota bacterium]MDQ6949275.1 DUF2252 domain-containing protein [Actinomycetota bacterium]